MSKWKSIRDLILPANRASIKKLKHDLKNDLKNELDNNFSYLINHIKWLERAYIDKGLSTKKLIMQTLNCPKKYEYILCDVSDGDLVIDGGANLGLFSDLMLSFDAKIFSFEPNKLLFRHLDKKYRGLEKIQVFDKALSSKTESLTFYFNKNNSFIDESEGGTTSEAIFEKNKSDTFYTVESIDLCQFIEDKLKEENKNKFKLIKLDIEGAEFDILEKIIEKNLFEKFDYLLCETHERLISNGDIRLKKILDMIKDKNITNIYLDWI